MGWVSPAAQLPINQALTHSDKDSGGFLVQMGTKGVAATNKAGVWEAEVYRVFSWCYYFLLM